MFAAFIANWWYGGSREEEKKDAVEEEKNKKKKRPVVDDDGIFSSEDEEDTDEEMLEIRRRFHAAAAYLPKAVDTLPRKTLLRQYGLYKAATAGKPLDSDRPSFFDQKGRAKFAAWEEVAVMTKKEAMRAYADELEDARVGFDPTATASTSSGGGFGMRMSRPMMMESGSGDMAASAPSSSEISPDAMEWQLWVHAAKTDDVQAIKRLLTVSEDILLRREEGSGLTGLHWAADSGSMGVCKFLLEHTPSLVHELDIEGNQPLHLASLCGYDDVVELLLAAGASPTIMNYEKESAIDIAATPSLKKKLMIKADEIEDREEEEKLKKEREEKEKEEEAVKNENEKVANVE